MLRFQSTLIFVIFPLIGNIVLAVAAFVFNPADFRDHLETCYLTIAAVLMAAAVSFIGFRIHDLGPKRTVLALLIQSVTLIFVFAGIYRGFGLLYAGNPTPLVDDWQSALYFTIITWTTLGYGDFTPPPELRLIAAIQVLLGYAFFGILVGLGTAILCEKRSTSRSQRPSPRAATTIQ
ncbi:potassium channel family protein [Bradyrhizobium arachidis]|uniref:potassium channel family protein n=1 Tax=Bradyrhizobium arachidis TaxID=858423 RepID=UPI002162B381|nr:potassium channel family protein [Bradyrhizobium arachidis]UVO30399.1 potassium channel family protein [Bradyrhizobium arachidis]